MRFANDPDSEVKEFHNKYFAMYKAKTLPNIIYVKIPFYKKLLERYLDLCDKLGNIKSFNITFYGSEIKCMY